MWSERGDCEIMCGAKECVCKMVLQSLIEISWLYIGVRHVMWCVLSFV